MSEQLREALIWIGFGLLTLLATTPVWRVVAFGVHPTLDQALLFICGGGR
jgi:hypothetical protein